MPNLHFIIISVPEDIPRRNHVLVVKEKLEAISPLISCEIFDGVYWKTNDVLKKLNDEKIALLPIGDSYAITQSQIGCFLSHYLVWKKIAESTNCDDKYIILEDDMDLSEEDFNFNELSETLETPDYDAIILWKHPARCATAALHHTKYLRTFYSQWGTTAYSITKEFAKILIDSINSINKPLDLILHDDIYPKYKVYVCLKEHFVNLGDLGSGENPKLKFKSLIFS